MERIRHSIRTTYHKGKHHARRIHAHPFGLPLVLFAALVFLSGILLFFGLKHDSPQLVVDPNANVIAIVSVDGRKQTVPTDAETVKDLLRKLNIRLGSHDRVEPDLDSPVAGDNFLVNVYRSAPMTVVDGDKRTNGAGAAATPRGLADQAGVVVNPEDYIQIVPTDDFVRDGSIGHRIVINRAVSVNLSLYSGKGVVVRTHAKTVGELIKTSKIRVTKDDTVKPSLKTPVTPGMQVAVVRNGIQTVTIEEEIPAPQRTVIDMSMSFGSQAIRQEGAPGKQTKTYKVVVEKGEEVSRTLLQSVVTVQPVERIIAKGNTVNIPSDKQAVMAAAGIAPGDYAYVDYIFSRESRWNAAAMNASGCGGLGQACPATKLANVCPNWQNDPVCQTRFFSGYATGRYGSWANAYNSWMTKHWW